MLSKEQIKVLDTIAPIEGFEYFSGYCSENSHKIPTIYVISGEFYVVGPEYEIKCKNFEKAIKMYRKAFKDYLHE